MTEGIEKRAKYFETLWIQSFDALHLSCAETEADILLTVNKKFLKKIRRIENLKIEVKNPLEWIEEVYYGKDNWL